MKNVTRHKISPVALLVLLVLLMLIAVRHQVLTAEAAEKSVAEVQDTVVRGRPWAVAVVAMVALLAYVMWTVLRANQGEAKAMLPAKESSASDKMAPL
jgi:hypothetical protein